ncbi:hypothetical protein GGE59_004641 [Rhizobium leguminosarum]|nr:hypothetical protein [Rhizobium leguminosarum]MBB4544016.1 hypothetical protein [Rhizobium leguminosarum]MBB5681646.1 hypothetical protein [Rhizobium leguminosarum]
MRDYPERSNEFCVPPGRNSSLPPETRSKLERTSFQQVYAG